jgi:hypothetical protein
MRPLFVLVTSLLAGAALHKRFRFPAQWEANSSGDLLLLCAIGGLGFMIADVFQGIRLVPGEETSAWTEWFCRILGVCLAAGGYWFSVR